MEGLTGRQARALLGLVCVRLLARWRVGGLGRHGWVGVRIAGGAGGGGGSGSCAMWTGWCRAIGPWRTVCTDSRPV